MLLTGGQALVVATADRKLHIFDLTSGSKVSEFTSSLQYQTRCVSSFADGKGFAVGCIEGRVALEYFDELHLKGKQGKGFSVPSFFVSLRVHLLLLFILFHVLSQRHRVNQNPSPSSLNVIGRKRISFQSMHCTSMPRIRSCLRAPMAPLQFGTKMCVIN